MPENKHAWILASDGEGLQILAIPAPRAVKKILNDFIADNRDRVNALLQPTGYKLDDVLQPEWETPARLEDLELAGDLDQHRSGIAAQMSAVNARARREAEAAERAQQRAEK